MSRFSRDKELDDTTPSDTEIVKAAQAKPQDDAAREQVISDLRRAVDPDDWYLMVTRNAGDLGGAELG